MMTNDILMLGLAGLIVLAIVVSGLAKVRPVIARTGVPARMARV